MHPTPYPDVNSLLDNLLFQMQQVLGANLVGLYLYGSLVTGDFDHECSDIDLLAVTASDVDEQEFAGLQEMHTAFARVHKEWEGRIEVAYLSAAALQTFRDQRSQIVVISPGEPLNIKDAGEDWLINWYIVREQGVTLFGPPPTMLIDAITKDEFIHCVKKHAEEWNQWIEHAQEQKAQSYAMLTMCRALYAVTNGEQSSKKQAAEWVGQQWSEWSDLLQEALRWRADRSTEPVDDAATYPQTVRFMQFASEKIVY